MSDSRAKMGYFCSLVPTEVIAAAGYEPVWVKGRAEMTAAADAQMYPNMCPYIKSLFTDAAESGGNGFDGLVFARSCDGVRRLYDVWKAYIPSKFIYMLEVPKNADDLAVTYYASQLHDFAAQIGKSSGCEITASTLRKAIKDANAARGKMRELHSRQSASPLPMSGSELFMQGIQMLHGDDGAKGGPATRRKSSAEDAAAGSRKKTRVMVCGNVMSRPDILLMIEGSGAEVPVADVCTGLRSFERIVDEKGDDPFLSLAEAYLGLPRCSRTAEPAETYARIRDNVNRYNVNGVVLTALKFCDQQLYDIPYLLKKLNDDGVPVLFVENDYVFTDKDRIRTRVEAFVEMLES